MAGQEDIETLFSIRTSVRENHQSREELASIGVTAESIAKMLRTDACAWLCELKGHAVGFAMADAAEKTIFAMFVRPEFEHKGIGRALMARAEDWLFEQGADEIWLATGGEERLRANGFYVHLGWAASERLNDGQLKYVKRRPDQG